MQGDDLAIFLFWLALFASFVLETAKAETSVRRAVFGGFAVVFLLAAIFWRQIEATWPSLSSRVGVVAVNPVSWFGIFLFVFAVVAFHRPGRATALGWRQRDGREKGSIQFLIRKSYVEVPGREFVGKSIIRCDAIATNATASYLNNCKFTAQTEMNVFERSEVVFSGDMPPGGTARLHLFDLLIENIGGEFLGYRFGDSGGFLSFGDLALIECRFGSKEIGLLEKGFHVWRVVESSEYVIVSDDMAERKSIIESLTEADE